MFRLHGNPISNFYNIAKLTLMEKGLDFEEVMQPPSQDEEFLQRSPLGKIPVLQVKEGYVTETVAIVEFLEDIYPEIPLYPSDPFDKTLVRRICHMAEIYLDLPFRPVLVARMTGQALSQEAKDQISTALVKGAKGISRVANPSPWVFGSEFTAADIFLYYILVLVAPMAQEQLGLDIYASLPGFDDWRELVAERDFVRQVDAANRAAMEKFFNRS